MRRTFVKADIGTGGHSYTVNKFVYCQTHFQGDMHCSEHPPVYEMGQKRRLVYSKQNCILYIEISIPFVIWQIVYMAIVGAKVGVF